MSSLEIARAQLWGEGTFEKADERVVICEWQKHEGYSAKVLVPHERCEGGLVIHTAIETRRASTRAAALRAFCALIEKHDPQE